MIMNSSRNNFVGKQEQAAGSSNDSKFSKIPSSSRQWGGFKNPRIVRVSRSFGGKDRHSKVCTIRGLRDRRIRLSVPTAIQLYDLQDRLGLSQPSKVVDWLLDATKHEVDKLPPLQIPPGAFTTSDATQPYSFSHLFNPNPPPYMKDEVKVDNLFDRGGKSKGIDHRETSCGKEKWIASNEQENQDGIGGYVPQLSAQNLFPLGNQLNSSIPFSSYYHWEPSNLSLAHHLGNSHSFSDHSQNTTLPVSLPTSSMSFPSGSQLYFCPTATTLPSIVPPYMINNNNPIESDPRQLNHFHFLSSSLSAPQHVLPYPLMPTLHLNSSTMKPFSLNEDPKGFHSREDDDSQQHHQGGSN